MHLHELCCFYNVWLRNNEVLKCIQTVQYVIVASTIDSYCNNIYCNKSIHTISVYWQHKSLYTGCLVWMLL